MFQKRVSAEGWCTADLFGNMGYIVKTAPQVAPCRGGKRMSLVVESDSDTKCQDGKGFKSKFACSPPVLMGFTPPSQTLLATLAQSGSAPGCSSSQFRRTFPRVTTAKSLHLLPKCARTPRFVLEVQITATAVIVLTLFTSLLEHWQLRCDAVQLHDFRDKWNAPLTVYSSKAFQSHVMQAALTFGIFKEEVMLDGALGPFLSKYFCRK